jgi:class 3 adenylate cyclase
MAPARKSAEVLSFERHVLEEGNAAMERAGLYAAVLGFVSAPLCLLVEEMGWAEAMALPAVLAMLGGAYGLALHKLAQKKLLVGPVLYAVFLPFVSLPTVLFLLTHSLLPAGAATFITGPFSYLYFILIFVTAFAFDLALSFAAGLAAAAGYMGSYVLAQPFLERVIAWDPTLHQDLASIHLYAFKAFMMVFAGLLAGGLSVIVRRLVIRSVTEVRQRERISHLFGQYVSDEVRERIVAEKGGTVVERKVVAVLFSDIRAFSTFSERNDPERVLRKLNEYFEAMVQCVTSRGGVVDKFIGDNIMAVFGGVLELPNPALAAVQAARLIRMRLRELNRRWEAQGEAGLENGVGIHLGEVLQGPIGSQHRKDFTVIGDTVNIAARIEDLTKQHAEKILISDVVFRALPRESQAIAVSLGSARLRGRQEEVGVYGIPDEPCGT